MQFVILLDARQAGPLVKAVAEDSQLSSPGSWWGTRRNENQRNLRPTFCVCILRTQSLFLVPRPAGESPGLGDPGGQSDHIWTSVPFGQL